MAKPVSRAAYRRYAIERSLIMVPLAFLFYWAIYSLGFYPFKSSHPIVFFAAGGIEAAPYCFFVLSYFYASKLTNPLYVSIFGIKKMQSRVIVFISAVYSFYPLFLLLLDDKLLTYNIPFLAMVTLEIVVVLYAGYDMINLLNLRWFLRTSPYCITGIWFVTYAMITMLRADESAFQNTDSLANAVLSFVTITYFVQVFNERFCKKQGEESQEEERQEEESAVTSPIKLINPKNIKKHHSVRIVWGKADGTTRPNNNKTS